jgi:hypothetical protein
MSSRWERLDTRRIALGLGLATLGILMLVGQFHAWDFWKLWPLWLGFVGVGKLMAHPSQADYADGILMLALCALFLSVNYNWLGLTWRNSWPLFIVFAGLSMVLGSFSRKRSGIVVGIRAGTDKSSRTYSFGDDGGKEERS